MVFLASLTDAIRFLVGQFVWLYTLVIIAAVVVTWVDANPWNPLVRFLRAATEPVFRLVRRWLPFVVVGGFDLSPLVVLVGLQAGKIFLDGLLRDIGRGF